MALTPRDNESWELIESPESPPSESTQGKRKWHFYIELQASITRRRRTVVPLSSNPSRHQDDLESHESIRLETTRPIHPQQQSPFLSIPPELRLHIYELLMNTRGKNTLGIHIRQRTSKNSPSVLTVLLTCRQILLEAEKTFYALDRLQVSQLQPFTASLNPRRLGAITKLTIPVSQAGEALNVAMLLHKMTSLHSIWLLRTQTARFTSTSSWKLLVSQIVAEIRRHVRLEEVKIITPELQNPTAGERERIETLKGVDKMIENAASKL